MPFQQHIQIIALTGLLVNQFMLFRFFNLPKSLTKFFGTGLDRFHTIVENPSNARKAHSGHDQSNYKTNY
jgi:hypothetical protein